MSLVLKQVSMPKTTRSTSSKYEFGSLVVDGPALVEADVIDVTKAKSRITSALVAYRARTGDKSKFAVRSFKNEDGTDAIGIWKTANAA